MEPINNCPNKKTKLSNRNCCVVGCGSVERENKGVHFYTFPNRPWEFERENKWIKAVRRTNLDGKAWQPTPNSSICSLHFCGGEKSNNPLKDACNLTLFPAVYKKKLRIRKE